LPLFGKDSEENALAMPPLSGVSVHIIPNALSLLVVVSYNMSLNYYTRIENLLEVRTKIFVFLLYVVVIRTSF